MLVKQIALVTDFDLGAARTDLGNTTGRWKSKPTVVGNRRFAASALAPAR